MFFLSLLWYFVALIVIVISYCKWSFSYWERRGLRSFPPSIPFGNTKDLFFGKRSFGEIWRDMYFAFKSEGLKHGGAYFSLKPVYVVVDLQLVKNILQNDFQNFHGHGVYVNEEVDPLSANLFNLDGPRWKTIRTKLTPTFTSGKIKMMFQTLIECSEGLNDILKDSSERHVPVDVKDVMARFTTDVIGSCAFGIECNSMKNPQSDFRKYGSKAIHPDLKWTIRMMAQLLIPYSILRFFNVSPGDPEVMSFFRNIVLDTIKYREKNNVVRKDFMHLLIQLKNKGTVNEDENPTNSKKDFLTLNEIAAQSFLFFVGGFETSSTTLNFAAYELAVRPDIQDKLREEIEEVLKKYDNKLTYEAVMEMTYMEKVIYETLRKHPPLQELFRECTKAYKVPDTDIVIEEGTKVMIPALGIHYDPEYYPDPDVFDPERFNEENKAKRPQFTWLPFGEGPRICIGLRFGVLQTKIGLISLLRNYQFGLNEKTKYPITYNKRGIITEPEGTVLIDLHKIE